MYQSIGPRNVTLGYFAQVLMRVVLDDPYPRYRVVVVWQGISRLRRGGPGQARWASMRA